MTACHEKMTLCITAAKFLLVPSPSAAPAAPSAAHAAADEGAPHTHLLAVHRNSSSSGAAVVSLERHLGQLPAHAVKRTIAGFMGIVRLPACAYLVVIRKKKRVGDLPGGHSLYRIVDTECISFLPNIPDSIRAENDRHLAWLVSVLRTPFLYFSYTGDLTLSQQQLATAMQSDSSSLGAAAARCSLLERADSRFIYNYHLLRPVMSSGGAAAAAAANAAAAEVHRFAVVVMQGSVFVRRCRIGERDFTWTLISRRSRHRVGTRFFARGCDDRGKVANFVETESMVACGPGDNHIAAFVQTRGSMPFFWQQLPNLTLKPKPRLSAEKSYADHAAAFRHHLSEQIRLYGGQCLVNLIDHRGAEGALERHFARLCSAESGAAAAAAAPAAAHAEAKDSGAVDYIAFDFHAECSKMRWQRLSILVDKLAEPLAQFGFFHAQDGKIFKLQTGTFRTNCVDCLDRTNVVQSLIAAENLTAVLQTFRLLHPDHRATATVGVKDARYPVFNDVWQNTWADNADLISTQYSGTGALKTDFTRTGERTVAGVAQDGANALIRYHKNNFCDGQRQDALHFFQGELCSSTPLSAVDGGSSASSPSSLSRLPRALAACLAALALALLLAPRSTSRTLLSVLAAVAVGCAAGIVHVIMQNVDEFVDLPASIRQQRRRRQQQGWPQKTIGDGDKARIGGDKATEAAVE